MAYTVKFGALDKRINSTKRPTAAQLEAWDSYDVLLKEATSYDRPTLLLNADFGTVIGRHYNYAQMFGRFYWVTDIRSVRWNVIEIDMVLDILATFNTEIRATKSFIEFGSNTFDAGGSGYRIADSRRPVGKVPVSATASDDSLSRYLSHTGAFILQAVSAGGGVACYALSGAALRNILSTIATDISTLISGYTSGIDPTSEATNTAALAELMGFNLRNSLIAESAPQAIRSIHWIPLDLAHVSGTSEGINLGIYATGISGKRISNNSIWSMTSSLTIPWQAADWRRVNSQISLYLPFFGTIPVPVDQCNGNAGITYTYSMDVLAGDLSVRVRSGDQTIYTGSTNVSAPYAYGIAAVGAGSQLSGAIQIAGGAMQMASGAIDAGAGIAGSFLGLGGVSAGVNAITSGAQNMLSGYAQTVQPLITSAGSMGGIAALGQSTDIILTLLYYPPIADTDFEGLYGHPVFKVDLPALGFCKTRGFSISLGAEASYSSYINAVMDGGCFIEE